MEEELPTQEIECSHCEAQYTIVLQEDYLDVPAQWCAFCGEYLVAEE